MAGKAVEELADKCRMRDIPAHTEFLNLNEQDIFLPDDAEAEGCALGTGRRISDGGAEGGDCFLPSYAEDQDVSMLPVSCVHILPLTQICRLLKSPGLSGER